MASPDRLKEYPITPFTLWNLKIAGGSHRFQEACFSSSCHSGKKLETCLLGMSLLLMEFECNTKRETRAGCLFLARFLGPWLRSSHSTYWEKKPQSYSPKSAQFCCSLCLHRYQGEEPMILKNPRGLHKILGRIGKSPGKSTPGWWGASATFSSGIFCFRDLVTWNMWNLILAGHLQADHDKPLLTTAAFSCLDWASEMIILLGKQKYPGTD